MRYLTGAEEKEALKWFEKAAEVAQKALCLRSKCGTVIVQNGEVVGEGYSAPPLDSEEHRRCSEDTCCVHAEQRAIMDVIKNNPKKLAGSTLYFIRLDDKGNVRRSGKPTCTVCSRLSLDAGVAFFALFHKEGPCVYPTGEYNRLSCENARATVN